MGWITAPIGLLLVAWAFFVAMVIVIASLRDGRPVARAAYATLVFSVLPVPFFGGAP